MKCCSELRLQLGVGKPGTNCELIFLQPSKYLPLRDLFQHTARAMKEIYWPGGIRQIYIPFVPRSRLLQHLNVRLQDPAMIGSGSGIGTAERESAFEISVEIQVVVGIVCE